MLKQLYLTAAILTSMQFVVPSSIAGNEVYCRQDLNEDRCCCCETQKNSRITAAAVGSMALFAGIAGCWGTGHLKKIKVNQVLVEFKDKVIKSLMKEKL